MTDDDRKHLSDLAEPGTTVMLGSCSDRTGFESRPMTVVEVEGSTLSYILDDSAPWAQDLKSGDTIHTTISDDRHNSYVSLNGTATVTKDPARIDQLWNTFADAFIEGGRSNPHIAVLTVDHDHGSYWDGPNGHIGSLLSFVRAKLTDAGRAGDHGDVALDG